MRSPLEAIEGAFEHAIFTTYSISLSFFEQWVMPLLAHVGVRNVLIFADASQLGEALLDSGAQRVGTAYQVAPVSLGPGAFHPKVMLLASSDHQRLVVSSANLTVSGQLRNLEIAAVLDSSVDDHRPAIAQSVEFFRGVIENAPSHIVEAAMPVLALIEPALPENPDIEFVHNLTTPISSRLPGGDIAATVPYADTDGRALRRVSGGRAVRCIVDGETFEAGESFFAVAEQVEPRAWRFDENRRRVLHAKAYWNNRQALIGSPNLSERGLLSTAKSGNVEAALLLSTQEPLPDPGGTPWVGDVRGSAIARTARSPGQEPEAGVVAFQAWEDEGQIFVEGVSGGALIDRFTGIGWEYYGKVAENRVIPIDETPRPRLLRNTTGGIERVAAVHRVQELRIRRARRISGRASEVVHSLPLDLEGVRVLEEVLSELFALGDLAETDYESATSSQASIADTAEDPPLTEWRPAHPGDEPRIPDIYRRSWSKDPDALLALVQAALRLGPIAAFDQLSDFDLQTEEAEVGEMEDIVEDADKSDEEEASVVTTAAVLRKYRQSFRKLLDRGVEFVKSKRYSVLGDLAFQTLMQQCERLLVTVEVNGRPEYLVDPGDVRRFRLHLLQTYLRAGDELDPLCAATARYHLADLIRAEHEWEPLEWEIIEHLAYNHAATLLDVAEPPGELEVLGLTSAAASAWLNDYAARADWLGVVDHASESLSDVDFALDPYPLIIGVGEVEPFNMSPAWECLGYGVVAGTSDVAPYGLAVRAVTEGPYDVHALVFDPATGVLHEAMRRQKDRVWLARNYQPVGRGDIDRAGRLGPFALHDAAKTPLSEAAADRLPDLLQPLARMASADTVRGES